MKKHFRLISALLAACMSLTMVAGAANIADRFEKNGSSVISVNDEDCRADASDPKQPGIMPFASDEPWDRAHRLSGTSQSESFALEGKYTFWKVWVENTGSSNIVITVTEGSPSGSVVEIGGKESITLKAGDSTNIYSKKDSHFKSGTTLYVNFTSGKGKMSGKCNVRTATTFSELDV